MEKLPGDYIAGFVDGEGCFYIHFRRTIRYERKNKPVYFHWDIGFTIVLRADDKDILQKIKNTLNCGRISISKNGQVRYEVSDMSDLTNKIAPFFENHLLRAKKKFDFILWKEALEIFKRNQQHNMKRLPNQIGFLRINWAQKDIDRLKQIKKEMEKYKSKGKAWKWFNQVT